MKKLKKIFETFTIFSIGWDLVFGFNIIILETILENPKNNNIDNITSERSLLRLDISKKRINYSILYSKLKTKKLTKNK